MNYIREQKGQSHGGVHSCEEEQQEAPIASFEEGRTHYLGSFEQVKSPPRTPCFDICSLVTSNPFGVLEEDPEVSEPMHDIKQNVVCSPPGLKKKMPKFIKPKKEKSWKPRSFDTDKVMELNNFEKELLSFEDEQGNEGEECEYIEVTVDSGAAESVMHKKIAKNVQVRESEGSKKAVKYVAAAGAVISNEGEKHISVETEEGHHCKLKMQIAAVNKALLSVSKICDAGHDVLFTRIGGKITHNETGQVVKFKRTDGVYRLRLKLADEKTSSFHRQGR